ncbi:MAG: hypothetical protein ABIH52_03975 [Candidatus Aenigmatarchaeota archaeon]
MNRKLPLMALSILIISFMFIGAFTQPKENFEDRREAILQELSFAIDDAVTEGKYSCCIDPPCTMCYMGSWLWDDGICRCDEMIRNGEFDKVCPQCAKGIEEGRCTSSETLCEIPN